MGLRLRGGRPVWYGPEVAHNPWMARRRRPCCSPSRGAGSARLTPPATYEPAGGLAFVAGIAPQPHSPGAPDSGSSIGAAPGRTGTGSGTAVAVRSGARRRAAPLPSPTLGGVTATAARIGTAPPPPGRGGVCVGR